MLISCHSHVTCQIANRVVDLWMGVLHHMHQFPNTRPIRSLLRSAQFLALFNLRQNSSWRRWGSHILLRQLKLIGETLQENWLCELQLSLLSIDLASDVLSDLTTVVALKSIHHVLLGLKHCRFRAHNQIVINPRDNDDQSIVLCPLVVQAWI